VKEFLPNLRNRRYKTMILQKVAIYPVFIAQGKERQEAIFMLVKKV